MTTQDSSLGTCPSCNATIPAGLVLIEYERADGAAAFANVPTATKSFVRDDPIAARVVRWCTEWT